MSAAEQVYPGSELELFRAARNWKRYWTSLVRPYVTGDVIEVGAGLGANTGLLVDQARHWWCLEPDPTLSARLTQVLREGGLSEHCTVQTMTLRAGSLEADTIVYLDVLEHIEDDRKELMEAAVRLKPGGHLIVLAPAHAWLFSPFDQAIGHYRRYTRDTLERLAPPGLELVRAAYLDSAGLVASLGNRLLLRRALPSGHHIAFWDDVLIPISCWLDHRLGYRLGKSVLMVWRKHAGEAVL